MGIAGLLCESGAADARLPALSTLGLGCELGRGANRGGAEDAVERGGHFDRRDGHGA